MRFHFSTPTRLGLSHFFEEGVKKQMKHASCFLLPLRSDRMELKFNNLPSFFSSKHLFPIFSQPVHGQTSINRNLPKRISRSLYFDRSTRITTLSSFFLLTCPILSIREDKTIHDGGGGGGSRALGRSFEGARNPD